MSDCLKQSPTSISRWVATGSERISYAGLQIAFAFFCSVYQGYAPDTDLDNVRDRVVGILFGLVVTGFVFQYIWPEREPIESASAK
jgi:multidrug resistance protein MdtO